MTMVASMETTRFKVKRVRWRKDGRKSSPIIDALDVKHRKYSRDVRMKIAELASKVSYNDSRLEFETATSVHIPKRTIHCFVQEIVQPLFEANKTAAADR